MTAVTDDLTVPEEIARACILPASYADLEGTVYPAWDWLRHNLPLGKATIEGYDPIWLASKHHTVAEVTSNAELFHNAGANIMFQPQAGDEYLRGILGGHTRVMDNLSYLEPPVHNEYRLAQARHFLPNQVRKFEPRFKEIAKTAVDNFLDQPDGPVDAVSSLSARYPLNAVLEMLGVPASDYEAMLKITQDTFGGDDPDWIRDDVPPTPEAMAKQWQLAVAEAEAYFDVIRRDRHAHPRDDLATAIVTAKLPDGNYMPDRIQNQMALSIAVAGHDTTNSAISAGLEGLARFPDQLALAKENPKLVPGLVEESLRWATPAKHFTRDCTADTEVDGVVIKQGDRVMCAFVSADFDEDVFPDPHRFDITRRPNRHMAFSHGPHICLGQHIAKIEMRALFNELLPRIATLEMAGEPVLKVSNFVSGFKSLPVTFTRA
jgi:alpha-terpineol hydroxylase